MGRAVSEGLRPLHFYNSLSSIGATANLVIPPEIAYLYTNKINLRENMIDGWLARKLQAESKTGSVLDSIADLLFVPCCAIQLLPTMSIPSWLWIWAGIIVIIKIVNQIIALTRIKQFCLPHTIANKLTGFLLFLIVPTISWSIIPIAIVAIIATFAAIQEGYYIGTRREII